MRSNVRLLCPVLMYAVGAALILVERVGCDAEFGDGVHVVGADLQLDALVAWPDNGRVDRLIAVLLRRRDIVLEPARHRAPRPMHDAERAIAILGSRNDDAKAVDVRQLLHRDLTVLHFAPDGIRLLFAAVDLCLNVGGVELVVHGPQDLVDQPLVLVAQLVELLHHRRVAVRVEPLERQFLELVTHALHAHAAGERGVDF